MQQQLCAYASCPHDGVVLVDGHLLCREVHAKVAREEAAPRVPPRPAPPRGAPIPLTDLPVRVLTEHPDNVRDDLGDLTDMTASVRAQGILQPLLITRSTDQRGTYLVIAGHRRLAAAIAAGLPRVPVRLRERLTGTDAIEAMLVENLQRKNLDPIEEARAFQSLLDAGRTQKQIATAIGKNQGHVSQRLALLNLTPAEQAAVRRKEITVDAAYRAGRDLGDRRRTGPQFRPKPKRVPHFTRTHPLAAQVATSCGHETTLKLGPACGPCWEAAIRADERTATTAPAGAA